MKGDRKGVQLFFHFVFPCAWDKVLSGEISERDFQILERCVKTRTVPKIAFLDKCFSVPSSELGRYAAASRREKWSRSTVYKFWRYHHGRLGNCAIRVGTVEEINDNCSRVAVGGKVEICFNTYGLDLVKNEKMLIHRSVIVIRQT